MVRLPEHCITLALTLGKDAESDIQQEATSLSLLILREYALSASRQPRFNSELYFYLVQQVFPSLSESAVALDRKLLRDYYVNMCRATCAPSVTMHDDRTQI